MENIISVIVLTYNQEKTIGRTLDSILMQKCHIPFEIELRDDCSHDGTDAICRQYAEKYPLIIRYRHNKQNKGIIDNYFDTLLECRGRYIADCAGDDFWIDPLKLEKEVNILEQHPEVTLVHTAFNYFDYNKKQIIKKSKTIFNNKITDGEKMIESIITQTNNPIIQLCTSLYRKDIFLKEYQEDEYMFRNKEFGCEDIQIAITMALNGKIAFINETTLNYSINHESVSYSHNEEKRFFFNMRTTKLIYYLKNKYNIDSDNINTFFKKKIFALYMHAFRSRNKELLQKAKQKQKEWNVDNNIKLAITKFVMSNKITWNIMLAFRGIFRYIKNILHKYDT